MVGVPRTVAILFLTMALAGCSGGGGSGGNETEEEDELPPGSTPSPPPAPPVKPPAPTAPAEPPKPRDPVTWDITIQGTAFVDGSITVQVGDTVRWTHDDGATPHNVRSSAGAAESFYSGGAPYMTSAPTRNVFEHEFREIGEDPYVCEIHSGMSETITVLEFHNETPA